MIVMQETPIFHRGENSHEISPADAVAAFIANRSQGVIGEVEATVVLANGLVRFKNDAIKLHSFLDGLREAKVLSQVEATTLAENKSASRVSKLIKIADYRDRLLDPRIRSWLTPGYSCHYEFVLLVEEVEKGQQGPDRVVEILSECDGEISRSWRTEQRKKLRSDAGLSDLSEEAPVAEIDPDEAPPTQPDGSEADAKTTSETPAKAESANRTVTALLVTDMDAQVARFGKELADGTASPCIKISGEIDANAVLLIDARADTLLSMSTIVGSLGFSQCVQVGLLSEPDSHDITSSRILAVYKRGNIELVKFRNWQSGQSSEKLAEQLLEGVNGRHVHLFATDETDGWESVVGDANWQR